MRKFLIIIGLFVFLIEMVLFSSLLFSQQKGVGKLEILSASKGAKVYIDGEPVGSIPIQNEIKLGEGEHTIKVFKLGYRSYFNSFFINADETTSLEIDLLPYAGIFTIQSNILKTRIYVDDKLIGQTPLKEVEIPFGSRKIRAFAVGYQEDIKPFQVEVGKFYELNFMLKKGGTTGTQTTLRPGYKPWYKKWWVWTLTGGLVAVGVISSVLGTYYGKGADTNPYLCKDNSPGCLGPR